MVYVVEYNDAHGDIVDREQYCNSMCADRVSRDMAYTEEGQWPGSIETDYNDYCPGCGAMLSHGVALDDCDDLECPECPPTVRNLVSAYDDFVLCDNCGCVRYVPGDVLACL